MTEISRGINRQVGLLVDRSGVCTHVMVGDAHKIFLPEFGRVRAGRDRFRGLRLWITHLNGEPLTRDNLTDLALLRLDLCLVIQAQLNGLPGAAEYAYLIPPNPQNQTYRQEKFRSVHDLGEGFNSFIRTLEDEFSRETGRTRSGDTREGVILLGVGTRDRDDAQECLEELARLADTAGLAVLDTVLQYRSNIDPKYVVGRGKLEDTVIRAMQIGAEVLVFDLDLKPSQLRSISERTDLKVLDRTQLILDIFAQHAESRAGKLQVEVAQLRYMLPRMGIMTTAMSRLTGGIGGRGPGETKLEINKRRARERLTRLDRQLRDLSRERDVRRKARERTQLPTVALVGYTNAGKSTLLNRLTNSSVRAEDQLFATLDPVSRRLRFPEHREIILTDTVGFIRDLPQDLVAAFRATLEEVARADLLLHVIDASEANPDPHMRAVETVLDELGAAQTPRLLVWSKSDTAPAGNIAQAVRLFGGIPLSAATGHNLEKLLSAMEEALWKPGCGAPADPRLRWRDSDWYRDAMAQEAAARELEISVTQEGQAGSQ